MSATASEVSPQTYLDGAPAEDAFQALVDRGLFSDKAPAPTATDAPSPAPAIAATPEPASPAPTEPEAEEFKSLDEYLTKQGVDRASFLELPTTIKVDGVESAIPLSQLLKSYQTDASVTQRSQALADQQKAWQAEQVEQRQQVQQGLQLANQIANLAHQELMREYAGVTVDDPVRYLQAQQRLAAIGQAVQQSQQAQQQFLATTLPVEQQKMLQAIPEWRDQAKFQEARNQLASYATTRGFTPAELGGIFDHRYMLVLRDAASVPALQAQVDTLKAQLEGKTTTALKLVRAAPPMAQPGARLNRDPIATRLQQVRAAGKGGKLARNEDAQAAAFSALVDAGA